MYNAIRKIRDTYNERKKFVTDSEERAQFERMAVEAAEQCAELIATMDVVVVKPEGPDPKREPLIARKVEIPEIPPEEDLTEISEPKKEPRKNKKTK